MTVGQGQPGPAAVTALMPLRAHRGEYLIAAINSMLTQRSSRWELIIVVEAAHEPGLREQLREPLSDPRIRMLTNEGRRLAGALNTGMRHARTPFVGILFADDLWSTEAVAVLERTITDHPDADFLHSGRRYIDEHGRPISGVYAPRPEVRTSDFLRCAPVKHLLCWRRSMALEVGGMDETLNSVGPDDLDFPWTMAERGAQFRAVPECLYVYRDHRECFRLSTHLPRRTHERELRRILRKHGVAPNLERERLVQARTTYLKQCLYPTPIHAKLRSLLGADPRDGWREAYR